MPPVTTDWSLQPLHPSNLLDPAHLAAYSTSFDDGRLVLDLQIFALASADDSYSLTATSRQHTHTIFCLKRTAAKNRFYMLKDASKLSHVFKNRLRLLSCTF